MPSTRLLPAAPLRDIVESIWVQEYGATGGQEPPSCVIPTGTIEILFQYRDRISHVEPGRVEVMPRSYVTGQRSRPVFVQCDGPVGIVLVSLYPWGLSSLLPACTETPDGYVDLSLILGRPRVAELEDRLSAARSSACRVRLIEAFLMALRAEGAGNRRMILASRLLASSTAPRPVHALAASLSMSRRHFARCFRSTIGLPPKAFSRIMRFQRAIRLRRDPGLTWSDIAVECGFSDQAHLIHEVKHFSARTPADLGIDRPRQGDYFNGNDVSRFFNTVYL